MSKQFWLDLAEVLDAHRIIPKLFIISCMGGYAWFSWDTYTWIKGIYECAGGIPASVAAYAGGTISALGTVLMLAINKYFDGGRKWQ